MKNEKEAAAREAAEVMKSGDHDPLVGRLQVKLLNLGYALPRWGSDGHFGDETWRAALACIQEHWPDVFPVEYNPDHHESLLLRATAEAICNLPTPGSPSFVTDLTGLHTPTACYDERRPLKAVTAIVLHQTAPGEARSMGEDPDRWFDLQAHVSITRAGTIFWVNKFNVIMFAANWFNRFSVSLEIDGHFEGVLGDDRTLWRKAPRPPAKLTPRILESSRRAVEWICDEVGAHGGQVTDILAHRQTKDSREADPGEAIWKGVGLWAQKELGLKNDVNYTRGSGKPIPKQWDERSHHGY